jgi:excisionase family DNA binding protein
MGEHRGARSGERVGDFATVSQFAGLLGVNRKTVYAAIQRGEIAGVIRVGRALKIHVATALRAQGIEPEVVNWEGQGRVVSDERDGQ